MATPEVDPATASAGFELRALDGRGDLAALDALPRRPRLVLSSARALQDSELILLAGSIDAELWDDLSDLPLRAANRMRVIDSEVGTSDHALWLEPRSALAADAAYSLALPGSTKLAGGGSALNRAGPAFIHELRSATAATAGARVLAASPADGSSGVPTNLRAAVLALDGEVRGPDDAIWLETADGRALPSRLADTDCASFHSAAVRCIELALDGLLAPNTQYRLRTGAGLRDGAGAPVEPFSASFATAAVSDRTPPGFGPITCERDERALRAGCALVDDRRVRLRVLLDEPCVLWARAGGEVGAQLWAARAASLTIDGLHPGLPFELVVRALDLAGNTVEARDLLETPENLATVSISEVLANPNGPEPAQEYVELANFGQKAVGLVGFALAGAGERERGSVVADAIELSPGAFALLVADDFDPESMLDGPLPAGTPLVHVGSSLTRSGLANSGEALVLRDAADRRLSAAPRTPAQHAGRCLTRVGTDPRTDDPLEFTLQECSPGR